MTKGIALYYLKVLWQETGIVFDFDQNNSCDALFCWKWGPAQKSLFAICEEVTRPKYTQKASLIITIVWAESLINFTKLYRKYSYSSLKN